MKKYLVPIDGSNHSEMALQTAVDIAKKTGGSITMLSVVDIDSLAYSSHFNYSSASFLEQNKTAFEGILNDLEKKYQDPSFNLEKKILLGNTAREILDEAENFYDLIVIGSHGKSMIQRTFLGSVSTKIVNSANIPTLVVKYHNKDSFNKILLPVDGSRNSKRAIKKAIELGLLDKAAIEVLHVSKAAQMPEADRLEANDPSLNNKIKEIFDGARAYLEDYPYPVNFSTKTGHIAHTICQTALDKECDIIVIGSRGLGAFSRTFLGSVSNELIHSTDKCVLITR